MLFSFIFLQLYLTSSPNQHEDSDLSISPRYIHSIQIHLSVSSYPYPPIHIHLSLSSYLSPPILILLPFLGFFAVLVMNANLSITAYLSPHPCNHIVLCTTFCSHIRLLLSSFTISSFSPNICITTYLPTFFAYLYSLHFSHSNFIQFAHPQLAISSCP